MSHEVVADPPFQSIAVFVALEMRVTKIESARGCFRALPMHYRFLKYNSSTFHVTRYGVNADARRLPMSLRTAAKANGVTV